MQPSALAKRVFPSVFVVVTIFYLYGLGLLPLVGPDEPRYAQVSREMFQRGDLVTPTLGGHTWFEKPALLYWMMIAAFKTFGISEWSARLGPALSGLLTIASVWLVARQVERTQTSDKLNDFGYMSAFIAATSLGLIVFSRGASFDIVITMTTSWALSFFLLSQLAENLRSQRWLLAGFYVFVGLSLIAKGLIGIVVPFGVVITYYLLRRSLPGRVVSASLVWGVPLALLVSGTWYAPVIIRHGRPFIDQFFIQHHFARYLSNKYHHPQPPYFYLLIIILLTLPWAASLIGSVATKRLWDRSDLLLSKTRVFAFAWLALPIIFFSFSGSKLPGYILPVVPGAALLAGDQITRQRSLWPMRLNGLTCILLASAGWLYVRHFDNVSSQLALVAVLPLSLAGLAAIVWARFRRLSLLLIGCSTMLTLAIVLPSIAPAFASRESVRDLLRLADARGYAQAPVFARRGDDRTAEFYASGRVVYDSEGEPLTIDELSQLKTEVSKRGGVALVILPSQEVGEIQNDSEVEVIGSNGPTVLVGVRLR